MLIRTPVPDDIPQIMSLAHQSQTAAHWSAREYDALFSSDAPKRVALVAWSETQPDAIAGFVIARSGSDEWEIENAVVDPKCRKQGIGALLIDNVLREARKNGALAILLEVRESNAAARALYAKVGFREEGRRPRYYRDPDEDAVLMRLRL